MYAGVPAISVPASPSPAGDRQPEVHDPRPAPAVHHDVRGLEIPVQDAALVGRGEAGAELARDLERLGLREPADPAQQRGEVFPVHVLHREEVAPVRLADVVHAADVRMRHLPRRPHLGEEAIEKCLVRREPLRQELQRDRLAELQVVGAVDLPHAAAPDQADDAVALGEDRARREASGVDRVGGSEAPDDRGGGRAAPPTHGRLRDRRRSEVRRHPGGGREGNRFAAGGAEARAVRSFRRAARAADHVARIVPLRGPRVHDEGRPYHSSNIEGAGLCPLARRALPILCHPEERSDEGSALSLDAGTTGASPVTGRSFATLRMTGLKPDSFR